MATKTYRMTRPCNNFSFVLQGKGGNKQRFVFEGGSVINNVPARIVLKSAYSQELLESSKPFKDGDIKLERVDNGKFGSEQQEGGSGKKTVVEAVTSPEGLIDWVASELDKVYKQPQSALIYAEKMGYVFPNLTIDG